MSPARCAGPCFPTDLQLPEWPVRRRSGDAENRRNLEAGGGTTRSQHHRFQVGLQGEKGRGWEHRSAASFFALKTHLDPMMLAPGGASSSLQVPAVFSVASSQSGQSGRCLASARVRGSRASGSAVSAANMYSSHSSSSSASNPLSADHAPPASSCVVPLLLTLDELSGVE